MNLAPVHDFAGKLRQPSLIGRLREYVLWQAALRGTGGGRPSAAPPGPPPDHAPVSINLDLTTACNYACDHCVDLDILNQRIRYDHDRLLASLDRLAAKGLKSAILIGGGEPTSYPKFAEVVSFLKARGVCVAIVSNGSGNGRILETADLLGPKDWVRLSLDSGTDETFRRMHKPRGPITLEQICRGIPPIKERNPSFPIGFSFIITWKGATANDAAIVENLHEIEAAARLARDHRFDFLSLKPFLERAPSNRAEIVGLRRDGEFDEVRRRIRESVARARRFEGGGFRVVESTNLKVLLDGAWQDYLRQPAVCHFTFFRQVLSPLGIFLCPAYRHVEKARLGDKNGFADGEAWERTRGTTGEKIRTFRAAEECKEVTCLYNAANWFIEDLILHPERLESLEASEENYDYFL